MVIVLIILLLSFYWITVSLEEGLELCRWRVGSLWLGASGKEDIHNSLSKWNPHLYNHRFTKNKKRRSSKDLWTSLCSEQISYSLVTVLYHKLSNTGCFPSLSITVMNWSHFYLGDCYFTDVEWVLLILCLLSVSLCNTLLAMKLTEQCFH